MDLMDVLKMSLFMDHHKDTLKSSRSEAMRINHRMEKANLRKSRRFDEIDFKRQLNKPIKSMTSDPVLPEPKQDIRKLQMLKWKEEKMKKKQMEPKKPPPFKVGVVTHPFVAFQEKNACKHSRSPCRRVTRAATRAYKLASEKETKNTNTVSFAPLNAKFNAPKINISKTKYTPKKTYQTKMFTQVLSRTPKKVGEINLSRQNLHKKTPVKSGRVDKTKTRLREAKQKTKTPEPPPKNNPIKENTPKKRRSKKKLDLSEITETKEETEATTTPSRKKRRSSKRHSTNNVKENQKTPLAAEKSKLDDSFTIPYPISVTNNDSPVNRSLLNENMIVMSPSVTCSRGKGGTKRENAKRLSLGYEETKSPQKTAQYFRFQLDNEVARLREYCEIWQSYQNEQDENIPEEGRDMINLAIGQTRLLISKKLEQFRSLIAQCESGDVCEGEGIIKVQDLQGFWDMVYMQVENCDLRFIKLQEMKDRNWQEEYAVVDKPKKKAEKPKVVKSSQASSGIREAIRAARMKSKTVVKPVEENLRVNLLDTKTFDGVFFSVTSPVKKEESPLESMKTPVKRVSLLKAVVSSEAKKKIQCTPHNTKGILKTSNMGKIGFNLDVSMSDSDDFEKSIMHPIDLNKTPAKGILKTPGSAVIKKNVKIISTPDPEPQGNQSFVNIFDNLQLDSEKKKVDEEKENLTSSAKKRKSLRRQSAQNLISFESPVGAHTRSRRSLRSTVSTKE